MELYRSENESLQLMVKMTYTYPQTAECNRSICGYIYYGIYGCDCGKSKSSSRRPSARQGQMRREYCDTALTGRSIMRSILITVALIGYINVFGLSYRAFVYKLLKIFQ